MADAPPPGPPGPARLDTTRRWLSLVIGVVMVGLGSYIALHPLWSRAPVTGNRWMDVAFAVFFLLRGGLYLRGLRRRPS